ncbi:hypothetical protein LCGC14_1647870 [marine sediment metagenome]|uniref:Uncharacterized protein n=1 Tax=marine sediment metagenome TaxID=412755 RepID=A0A0F9KDJ5_9ZZZZ
MKATEIRINKSCREFHGDEGAWDEAIMWMKSRYLEFLTADCNKDAPIRLEIHIDK